jgi:predicted RNA polymerase sigma factor
VRAKSKIRDANIPYQVPARDELPERLESVLRVVYLVFNEGYSASSGDSATRADLSGEAIRLGRLIVGAHSRTRSARVTGAHAAARIAPRDTRDPGRRIDPAR